MNPKSLSPITADYNDAYHDSSNTSFVKICILGMKCPSLIDDEVPACDKDHHENPQEMIAKSKKEFAESQKIKSQKTKAPEPAADVYVNSSSPIPFQGNMYDVSIKSQNLISMIPDGYKLTSFTYMPDGSITYNVEKMAPVIAAPVIAAPVIAAPVIAAPVISALAITPKPATVMNVNIGATNNSVVTSSSPLNSNITKLLLLEKKEKEKEKEKEEKDNSAGWEIFKSEKEKKQNKKKNTDDKPSVSPSTSPVPASFKDKDRSSPSNFSSKKNDRSSPITTTKKACNFKDKCNKKECTFEHPDGYIPGSIAVNVCHNGEKCYNQYCKFTHPEGYLPKPNVRCLGEDKCHKEAAKPGSCPFSHPGDKYYDSIPENTRKNTNKKN